MPIEKIIQMINWSLIIRKSEEIYYSIMNFLSCESELERKRGFVVNREFVDGWKYEDKGW